MYPPAMCADTSGRITVVVDGASSNSATVKGSGATLITVPCVFLSIDGKVDNHPRSGRDMTPPDPFRNYPCVSGRRTAGVAVWVWKGATSQSLKSCQL